MDCIFCKIISGEIPSKRIYEDEDCYAFQDSKPQMPVHALVVPKRHIGSLDEIDGENSALIARIFEAIPKIAWESGLKNGYRVISNCGDDACQTIKHLHFHVLGGKKMSEKIN